MYLTDNQAAITRTKTIFSGKFRRYHGESWLRRLTDVRTNFLNVRDGLYFVFGFVQSVWLLSRLKPDVVFLKGGYVGVPIGLAAGMLGIPFMTHDSDAIPGLANRLVARWASLHAVAGKPADYPYPAESVRQVGVIVSKDYQLVSAEQQRNLKKSVGIPPNAPVLLVTGGSLGAERLNISVKNNLKAILAIPNLYLVHQVGKGKASLYDGVSDDRLQIYEFLSPMHEFTGLADIVLTRAGANTLAELGVQGKVCIIVPNDQLTDGHQTKNAKQLQDVGAAIVVSEHKLSTSLVPIVKDLLDSGEKRKTLSRAIHTQMHSDAAQTIAHLLITIKKA